jgi:hypothetical protein
MDALHGAALNTRRTTMQQHVFQLDSGEEFTIPAMTIAAAWLGAVEFLTEQGVIHDVANLAYNGTR